MLHDPEVMCTCDGMECARHVSIIAPPSLPNDTDIKQLTRAYAEKELTQEHEWLVVNTAAHGTCHYCCKSCLDSWKGRR